MKTNIKSYVAYQMAPLQVTFKVTFAVWNLCVHPLQWFTSMMVCWRSNMRCRQQQWW